MDFEVTREQRQLLERVTSVCTEYCTEETANALDSEGAYPEELHQALCEKRILGHCLPVAHGGGDGGFQDLVIIAEALGAHSNVALNIFFVNMAVGTMLLRAGNDEQHRKFLKPLIAGKFKGCFSLTEPDAGSDASAIQCQAVQEDGHYTLNGTKLWATGAGVADSILIVARTSSTGKASHATSLFLVPANADGLQIIPLHKLAGNAVASCKLVLNDVRVDAGLRIGVENQGWSHLAHTGGVERLTVAAGNLGAAQTVFKLARQFARDRKQFGQPIAAFQSIQHKLVDMATEIEAMRWLIYSTAWKLDQGQKRAAEISMAKLYSTDRLNDIVMQGMRIFGGRAYEKGHAMERMLRESILSLYAGGTAEIQRNTIAKYLDL